MRPMRAIYTTVVMFAFIGMSGCASGMNGVKQTLTNVSIAVAGGYQTLGTIDKTRQTAIVELAKKNPAEAKMELEDHLRKYDIAWKALNTATVAIKDTAAGIRAGKDMTMLVAALMNAASDVTKSLASWGVIK